MKNYVRKKFYDNIFLLPDLTILFMLLFVFVLIGIQNWLQ